jgi:ABC-type transport system substrate-binding protein
VSAARLTRMRLSAASSKSVTVSPSMINASVATTDPTSRFAAYSKLLQKLGTDVPVVPLYTTDLSIALSSRFSYSGLSFYYLQNGAYALNIKPAT